MNPSNDNTIPAVTSRAMGFMPRGLNRKEVAFYIGVSASLFDEMVQDGRAPPPRMINRRTIWDVREVDDAFERLPRKNIINPWDQESADVPVQDAGRQRRG